MSFNKAEHQNFTSATCFHLPREQMEEFLHKIWWRHSCDVYEVLESEENEVQAATVTLE